MTDELKGIDKIIGRDVLEDPRVVEAYEKIKKAIEVYEDMIIKVNDEKKLKG